MLIVLACVCFWFLLEERWLLAGVAAALASATRPNGVALVAACAVAAFIAIRQRRDWWSLVAPLLAPIGFIALPGVPRGPHRRALGVVPRPARGVARGDELRCHGDQQHVQLPRPSARVADRCAHRGVAPRPRRADCGACGAAGCPWPMVAYVAVVIGV